MTDHLPECPITVHKDECCYDHPLFGFPCWCSALRACEQRVLDAAREAVAALPMMKIAGNYPLYDADETLAAIDALREEDSANPDNPTSAGKPDKPGERRQFTLDEYEDVKRRAFFAGLDAAYKAVESVWTLDPFWDGTNWNNALSEALAAIDALRDPAISTLDDGNAGTEQIADPALHESPRQDR